VILKQAFYSTIVPSKEITVADIEIKPVTLNAEQLAQKERLEADLITNASYLRQQWLQKLVDPCRDIDEECGYPAEIDPELYTQFFRRHGIAKRIVSIYPEECWKKDPEVFDVEDEGVESPFEKAQKELVQKHNLNHYLCRIDILSGINTYGILLLGIDDNRTLDQPAEGLDDKGERTAKRPVRKLTYLRCLTDTLAPVAEWENDETNPRFGQPKSYNVQFVTPQQSSMQGQAPLPTTAKKVHWTRVIHVADNCTTSEVFGTPRLEDVFNFLYDLKKLLGGSGEMFWKGGFPGYSFEVAPGQEGEVDLDENKMKQAMDDFSNKLTRYLALVGVTAKSLAPQVADPSAHIQAQLDAISIAKAIPKRILMGSEQGELAATEDKSSWVERLQGRMEKYLSPCLLRRVYDRFIALGILPVPAEDKYVVKWPDLASPSWDQIVTTAVKLVQAISSYAGSGADAFLPPMEFWMMAFKLTQEKAEALVEAMVKHIEETEDNEEDLVDQAGNSITPDGKIIRPEDGSDPKRIEDEKEDKKVPVKKE